MVHRHRLAGREDVDVDPELREARLTALEARVLAEIAVEPARVLRVQDEPAVALGHEAALLGRRELRLRHARILECPECFRLP